MRKGRIFIVLGMHRSGTSAITRSLELFGVGLGDNLQPAGADNPKGFWEDRDCLQINEELLVRLNSAYDQLGILSEQLKNDSSISDLKIRSAEIILQKLSENRGIWGFKDPRTSRLLPFWQEVINPSECEIAYIIAVRNPLSVAASLKARNDIPYEKSYFLWLQHILPALKETEGKPRVIIDFDLLLENPLHELHRLSSHLDLDQLKADSTATDKYVSEFLDKKLNHSRLSIRELELDARAPKDVLETYKLLLSASKDTLNADEHEFNTVVNEIYERVKSYSPAFEYVNSLEKERLTLYKSVAEHQSQIAALYQQINDTQQETSRLHKEVGVRDTQVGSLHQNVFERDASISKLQDSLAARENLISELHSAVMDRNNLIDNLRQSATINALETHKLKQDWSSEKQRSSQLSEELKDQNRRLAESEEHLRAVTSQKKQDIDALHNTLAERNFRIDEIQAKILNSGQHIKELKNQVEELAQTITVRQEKEKNLQAIIFKKDKDIEGLKIELQQREHALNSVHASKSWKLTSPLRIARRLPDLTIRHVRKHASDFTRLLWKSLPIGINAKLAFKNSLFSTFPFVFSGTAAYRNWRSFRRFATSNLERNTFISPTTNVESSPPLSALPVRLIAFYLPQFHPIPENDEWWGKGFTEWTNVTRAQPQFEGHYQPHLPADLGFYDLRVAEVQKQQVALAKQYGVSGFCFYFYWFGGKRLLESPVQRHLNNKELDLPFCLCWANENWSRRWDGLDNEILIGQNHSPEDDIAFIEYIEQYLRDPRYIRINSKPVILVYRPSLLPSARETAGRWRNWCLANGIGEIFLAYTQSFETIDPAQYGFDAAIEFPPNNSSPPVITEQVSLINPNFTGIVYDWNVFVERSRAYLTPAYRLFRSVCPSWDNTARRANGGAIFFNSSPEKYQEWLTNACDDTIARFQNADERLIFINAWNEWAEGAHLEPDQLYGYAWLEATHNALTRFKQSPPKKRIIVVSHDAHPHGAQLLALNMARSLSQEFGFAVDLILLGEGPLWQQFQAVARVHRIDIERDSPAQILERLRQDGAKAALVNTTVSGLLVPLLKQAGFSVVSLIHELPGILNAHNLQDHAQAIADSADAIVFPAHQVQQGFENFIERPLRQATLRPQGLYHRNSALSAADKDLTRWHVRQRLGLSPDARIILSAGYGDYRKGFDLFIEISIQVLTAEPSAVALWVGHLDTNFANAQLARINTAGLEDRFLLTGLVDQPQEYFSAADVFALTSREDPFPSVVLESYDALTPVVGFEGVGGFECFLKRGCGVLVPAFNTDEFAKAIFELLIDRECATQYGRQGKSIVDSEFNFKHYLFDLLDLAGAPQPRISVVVPNYNYARYLKERLFSIVRQTIPIYELIILDDASQDNSIDIINDFIATNKISVTLIVNAENSGSVFSQWRKGVEAATGDYIWIAEADDLADPMFLEAVIAGFDNKNTVLSYCESRQIDANGNVAAENYHGYVTDLDLSHWRTSHTAEGLSEIQNYLAVKNTIPNVSAVLFKKERLKQIIDENFDLICSYSIAGDWLVYVLILQQGMISFTATPLNSHRRHDAGMTIGNKAGKLLDEIHQMQEYVASTFDISPAIQRHANCYFESLVNQFGLPHKNALEFSQ